MILITVPDGYADIIISTHTLEHVENPLGALRELRNKLKENGKAVFHVPNESCSTEYVRSEPNNHRTERAGGMAETLS